MNIRFERNWTCEIRGHTFHFEKGNYEVGPQISKEAAKLALEARVAVPVMPRMETKEEPKKRSRKLM